MMRKSTWFQNHLARMTNRPILLKGALYNFWVSGSPNTHQMCVLEGALCSKTVKLTMLRVKKCKTCGMTHCYSCKLLFTLCLHLCALHMQMSMTSSVMSRHVNSQPVCTCLHLKCLLKFLQV